MTAIRNNEKRAAIASFFLIIYLVLNIIDSIICYIQYDLFFRVKYYGHIVTDEQASFDDIRNRVIHILSIILFIHCVITFLNWFRRAYYNLEQLANFTNYNDRQAVYYWFIPIINWFKPYLIVKDLFEETDIVLNNRIKSYQIQTPKKILALWWGFWVVNNIFGNIVFRSSSENIEDYMTKNILEIISNGLCIVTGIYLLLLMKKYHSMEKQLREIALGIPEENPFNSDNFDGSVIINDNA